MRFLVHLVTLLAAAAAVSAFQGAGMLGRLSSASRKLNEFLVAQQLPAPQDELKHLVGTAESAVVDGVPVPLKCVRLPLCTISKPFTAVCPSSAAPCES